MSRSAFFSDWWFARVWSVPFFDWPKIAYWGGYLVGGLDSLCLLSLHAFGEYVIQARHASGDKERLLEIQRELP